MGPEMKAAGPLERPRRLRAMRPAASAGGVRYCDALREAPASHFPAYCRIWNKPLKVYRQARLLSIAAFAVQTARCGYSASTTAR